MNYAFNLRPKFIYKQKIDLSTSITTENLNHASSQEFGEAEESEESDNSSSDHSNTDYSCESDDDKEPNDGEDEQNHSNTSSNCTSGSENTTHSYPSSLLEMEDDLHSMPNLEKLNLSPSLSDLNNGSEEKTLCESVICDSINDVFMFQVTIRQLRQATLNRPQNRWHNILQPIWVKNDYCLRFGFSFFIIMFFVS